MSNVNGLFSAKIVAGTANIEESSYFVLNTDPVSVDTLSANEIVANTIISGTVEVNTNIDLNGGILTVSGNILELDGVPVGDASTWSQFPATQAVDISNYDISNARNIYAANISGYGIRLRAKNALGSPFITDFPFLVIGGTDRADISNTSLDMGFVKDTYQHIDKGDSDLTRFVSFGKYKIGGLPAGNTEYANIKVTTQDTDNANLESKMTFMVRQDAVRREMLVLDGSNSLVSVNFANLDMTDSRVLNLPAPIAAGDATRKSYVDATTISGTLTWSQYKAISTVDVSSNSIINLPAPVNANDAARRAYVDSAVIAGAAGWSGYPATQNVDISGFSLLKVAGIRNIGNIDISASGTGNDITIGANDLIALNAGGNATISAGGTASITGSDVNLNCTGITSILNINSALGTLIASVGAIDITAGGTTAINSTGNVSIGSLGTTSIENFNMNNSVLTKVAATADLELNNIATLNNTTPGSLITSKAIILTDATTSANAVGFQSSVASTANDAAGFVADTVTSSTANAYGAFISLPTGATARGVYVEAVTGSTTSTGVELAGAFSGTTQRGFYEHSDTTSLINTLMNNTGIGKDPSGVKLDVLGQTKLSSTTGGRVFPTLEIETTSAAAPGAYLQFYHNSATPDIGDRAGVMDFYGNNALGTKKEFARIRTLQDGIVNGAEHGAIDMATVTNGSMTTYMSIDGSNNRVTINPDRSVVDSFKVFDNSLIPNNMLINADCSNGNVMFKNYPQRYIYDISGEYTLTIPNFNTMRMVAYGAGGGGGGGGKRSALPIHGGGAGAGGNGVEVWYDRQELMGDASGSITFYITVGRGGDAGLGATLPGNINGGNGAAGGTTFVNLDTLKGLGKQLFYQLTGGNGGSGGTQANGTGGLAAIFSGGNNCGSAGRGGASSAIAGTPPRNLAIPLYCGTMYCATGGSGAGGGISAGAVAYDGGIFASPGGQKYNGFGLDVNKGGIVPGGNGSEVSFNAYDGSVRPLYGGCDMTGGGAASATLAINGGKGGEHPAGTPGSRGSGGGGGGAARDTFAPAGGDGGRGSDGFVYLTFW